MPSLSALCIALNSLPSGASSDTSARVSASAAPCLTQALAAQVERLLAICTKVQRRKRECVVDDKADAAANQVRACLGNDVEPAEAIKAKNLFQH